MQQCLKPAARAAGARVIATELLEKLFVPVYNAIPAFDSGFGRVALPTLARGLETRTGRGVWFCASWYASVDDAPKRGRRIIATVPGAWRGIGVGLLLSNVRDDANQAKRAARSERCRCRSRC